MRNKCTLTRFRNGTWWTTTVPDSQRASRKRGNNKQTASQTVQPVLGSAAKLGFFTRLARHPKKCEILIHCIVCGLLGISLAYNIYQSMLIDLYEQLLLRL